MPSETKNEEKPVNKDETPRTEAEFHQHAMSAEEEHAQEAVPRAADRAPEREAEGYGWGV